MSVRLRCFLVRYCSASSRNQRLIGDRRYGIVRHSTQLSEPILVTGLVIRNVEIVTDLAGMLRGSYQDLMTTNINAVRAGITSADEARPEIGFDPRGGEANELRPQAVGGRPPGTGDGDNLPPAGGSARPNGSALQ